MARVSSSVIEAQKALHSSQTKTVQKRRGRGANKASATSLSSTGTITCNEVDREQASEVTIDKEVANSSYGQVNSREIAPLPNFSSPPPPTPTPDLPNNQIHPASALKTTPIPRRSLRRRHTHTAKKDDDDMDVDVYEQDLDDDEEDDDNQLDE
ncbi:MAG: hypothetical protein MMC33_004107 [Icmadophila ericetorum]|nr:hypothetical protein [Icmadophila ericetorum]